MPLTTTTSNNKTNFQPFLQKKGEKILRKLSSLISANGKIGFNFSFHFFLTKNNSFVYIEMYLHNKKKSSYVILKCIYSINLLQYCELVDFQLRFQMSVWLFYISFQSISKDYLIKDNTNPHEQLSTASLFYHCIWVFWLFKQKAFLSQLK